MLELQQVQLSFGNKTILQQLSFTLQQGEIACLLGHSGCGKTTALRAIAGFETVGGGQITLNGHTISSENTHTPAHLRGIGMVFQDYALFPHLNVADNIAGRTVCAFGEACSWPTQSFLLKFRDELVAATHPALADRPRNPEAAAQQRYFTA